MREITLNISNITTMNEITAKMFITLVLNQDIESNKTNIENYELLRKAFEQKTVRLTNVFVSPDDKLNPLLLANLYGIINIVVNTRIYKVSLVCAYECSECVRHCIYLAKARRSPQIEGTENKRRSGKTRRWFDLFKS